MSWILLLQYIWICFIALLHTVHYCMPSIGWFMQLNLTGIPTIIIFILLCLHILHMYNFLPILIRQPSKHIYHCGDLYHLSKTETRIHNKYQRWTFIITNMYQVIWCNLYCEAYLTPKTRYSLLRELVCQTVKCCREERGKESSKYVQHKLFHYKERTFLPW
jgi:c-di-AMP phosphodiesterase-like protein